MSPNLSYMYVFSSLNSNSSSDFDPIHIHLTLVPCVPPLTWILCIFWFGHMCPPSLRGRMCSCSDLNPIWSHEFKSLYSLSDLGPMPLLLTLFLCGLLLNWVLCIFFWFWLSSSGYSFWPVFCISSSDLDPMRSSSDQGSMYLLLNWVLCVPLLTRVLCIFFWLWSHAFLFWPRFYISSSDLDHMRSSSDQDSVYLLPFFQCVPFLTLVLWIFFWLWSYTFLFWPGFYESSSEFGFMHSYSDLVPPHVFLFGS